jgi:hypothetical protein
VKWRSLVFWLAANTDEAGPLRSLVAKAKPDKSESDRDHYCESDASQKKHSQILKIRVDFLKKDYQRQNRKFETESHGITTFPSRPLEEGDAMP